MKGFRSILAALAILAAPAGAALAQGQTVSGPPYPAAFPKGHYGELNALPDWGGVWTLEFTPGAGSRPPPPQAKGVYLERYDKLKAIAKAHNGEFPHQGSYCTPPGLPGIMQVAQYPIEFLFTPGKVTMLFEAWMQVRHIFTDGRPHPDGVDPTFYGHSIGHWEGDTLVVDTVALKPAAELSYGIGHSDKERIVERFHLAAGDPNTLVDEMTITDPEALAQPWTTTMRYQRHRDWELMEFICAENDRNPVSSSGQAGFAP